MRDEEIKVLHPVTLPASRLPAPDYIMKLVSCSCASETPCYSKACGCVAANMACTMFCKCQGGTICNNVHINLDEYDDDNV